jgi:hypothetical protein
MVADAILAWPRPFPASMDSSGRRRDGMSAGECHARRLGRAAALVCRHHGEHHPDISGAFSGNCAHARRASGGGRKSFALAFAGTNLWRPSNGIGVIPNATAITTRTGLVRGRPLPGAGDAALARPFDGTTMVDASCGSTTIPV